MTCEPLHYATVCSYSVPHLIMSCHCKVATLTLRENIFIQKTEVVLVYFILVWRLLEGVWTCTWHGITLPLCLEQKWLIIFRSK